MNETTSGEETESASVPPVLTDYHLIVSPLQGNVTRIETFTRRFCAFVSTTPLIRWITRLNFSLTRSAGWIILYIQSLVARSIRRFIPQDDFLRERNARSLLEYGIKWLKHPMNICLLVWTLSVGASGAMVILLLSGFLNNAFPTKALRNYWIEVNNQVLNALFTLLSIYEHPHFFHHIALLYRWSSHDAAELRKIYCNYTSPRPGERAHMAVVVIFLHITCFSQYGECVMYWCFSEKQRPEVVETIFFASGVAALVFAGLYMVGSPLGEEHEALSIQEACHDTDLGTVIDETRAVVNEPQWAGTMFDCCEDRATCCLSFFCTCCVFGWNLERLGFGNKYLHTVMFLLLCLAPFWVFSISALHIHNYILSDLVHDAGMLLCFLGLLYGGYWRIQMRKKFRLPPHAFLCGSTSLSDYARWLFCWSCALAQEVRTADLYEIGDDGFYIKLGGNDLEDGLESMIPTNLENPPALTSSIRQDGGEFLVDEAMDAPVPLEMDAVGGSTVHLE